MSKRSFELYLDDILTSISRIEDYAKDFSLDTFAKDQKTIDAVVRNLEIIGEAARNIPEDYKEEHSHLPWGEMMSMRNKVIHEYFGVDINILWQTIQEDLPKLKDQLNDLIS